MTRPEQTSRFFEVPPLAGKEHWYLRDHTDRTYQEYIEITGIDFDAFIGKTILDLGSGLNGRFVRQAQSKSINAIGINPNWSGETYEHSVPPKCVAGLAEALPFLNDSFDFIISLGGIPFYLPNSMDIQHEALSEVRRVLKPGAWAVLDPIPKNIERFPGTQQVVEEVFANEHLIIGDFTSKLILLKEPTDSTFDQILVHYESMKQAHFPI